MLKNLIKQIFHPRDGGDRIEPPSMVKNFPVRSASFGVPVNPMTGFSMNKAYAGMEGFTYTGGNRSDFYRYLRDHIPIVSAAVWTWKHLCATPQSLTIEGDESEVQQARKILEELDKRVHFNSAVRNCGVNRLCEEFFLELFTTGSFAGVIIPLSDGSGIDYFHQLDSTRVQWERRGRLQPFIENDKGDKVELSSEAFYYAALGQDIRNPGGIEPMASIPFVVAVEQMMLEDMARSSHNAGNPRLHVRITPPPRFDSEGDQEYIDRVNAYFDSTANQFNKLEADENLFTWADVEIKVVGADTTKTYVWRVNREQVIEDVITGLKLFPWALGRSHGATKNWVEAQFNLLMQIVDSVQEAGSAFSDWLRTTELRMKGNLAKPRHRFTPNQDPFMLQRRQAEGIHFRTVHQKFKEGYLSKEQAQQEMGS
ncbi:hypothetical protein ISS30_01705 [bacterium]|nr:hypothetical protein [bacterium]